MRLGGDALRRWWWAPLLALLAIVYFIFDPAQTSFMPRCAFHELTGLQCAGCGSQRCIHALLHLDFPSAWHYNALLVCLIPLLAPMIWLEMTRTHKPKLYARVYSTPAILIFAFMIVGWTIARNL